MALHRPGENPMRVKTLRMGEKTLHEEKTQVNREGIQRGAYKIDSTANDTSEWMQGKKRIQLACKHDIKKSTFL